MKYAGIAKLHHASLAGNLKAIQIFSLLVFFGLIISIFYQPIEILVCAAVSGVFTLLYALPVFSKKRNLRALPGFKIYVIGFVVSIVTVLLPLVLYEDLLQRDIVIEFIQRFLLVIALIIPFEIRDLKFDTAQLGTIPQKTGVDNSKKIGYFLVAMVVTAEYFKQDLNKINVIGISVMAIITIFLLKGSTIKQGEYYASFWVESIPIMWFLLLVGLTAVI